MISFEQQIYLYSQPIDMRKSINGLSYLVSDLLEENLQDQLFSVSPVEQYWLGVLI